MQVKYTLTRFSLYSMLWVLASALLCSKISPSSLPLLIRLTIFFENGIFREFQWRNKDGPLQGVLLMFKHNL